MNQVSSRNRSGRWFYDRNHIENLTPSRKAGIDAFDELRYRQTAASFIQVYFRIYFCDNVLIYFPRNAENHFN